MPEPLESRVAELLRLADAAAYYAPTPKAGQVNWQYEFACRQIAPELAADWQRRGERLERFEKAEAIMQRRGWTARKATCPFQHGERAATGAVGEVCQEAGGRHGGSP